MYAVSEKLRLATDVPVPVPAPARVTDDLGAHWARVKARLRAEAGEAEYRSWLRQMTLGPLDGDEITVYLPSHFLRDWVRAHYGARLNVVWQSENPLVRRVDIRQGPPGHVHEALTESLAPDLAPDRAPQPAAIEVLDGRRFARPLTQRDDFTAPLDPRLTFRSFVVGKPNEFAHACARRVADKPASAGFNPLFLYGGVGLGKTHLMHAIAWELTAAADRRCPATVAYMSAEKFMYRFIGAIRNQSTLEFKDQLRSVDVLMIDDLQFLIGKDNTQEEFFHTFNALVEEGRQIVVSADKSPSDLSGLEDRLRTRLGCGMVADLHATTFELRLSILEAKAASSAIEVPLKVIEYLATKIATNVRELEAALNRLIAHANLFGRPITLESTQDVLVDVLKVHDRQVTIDEIQKKVAEHFNMRVADMSSARRSRSVARPRQVAMYLAKQLTTRSLPEIGRKFGNRDHTTVIHGVNKVLELIQQDRSFADDVELLRRSLEG
jgi:chromosomal replication initiator protein